VFVPGKPFQRRHDTEHINKKATLSIKALFTVMLSVANKPVMLSVSILNVAMLSLVAPFQSSLMFASKARAYPSVVPFMCSILGWAHVLNQRNLTRLARDTNSSLLGTFVNYGRKMFYNIGP
jgi:hypothetical protein